jgi:hypothetical protein
MKYIVETLSTFKLYHVVEAENEADAMLIAENADDNYQDWLGITKYDIEECTDTRLEKLKDKKYFWDGASFINDDGFITYKDADGNIRSAGGPKVK